MLQDTEQGLKHAVFSFPNFAPAWHLRCNGFSWVLHRFWLWRWLFSSKLSVFSVFVSRSFPFPFNPLHIFKPFPFYPILTALTSFHSIPSPKFGASRSHRAAPGHAAMKIQFVSDQIMFRNQIRFFFSFFYCFPCFPAFLWLLQISQHLRTSDIEHIQTCAHIWYKDIRSTVYYKKETWLRPSCMRYLVTQSLCPPQACM